MRPLLFGITQVEPTWADLNRGMDRLPDLTETTTRIRSDIMKKSDSRHAIARDNAADFGIVDGVEAERVLQTVYVTSSPPTDTFGDLSKLRNPIDLDKVIINAGFAEVGPWGSSGTRWGMGVRGDFTLEVGSRWLGSWDTSTTSTVASSTVRCMLVGSNRNWVSMSTRRT